MKHTLIAKLNQDTPAELAAAVKDGDRTAFREVYNRYNKQLYFTAMQYLRHREMAEDAVQDIFIKLWLKKNTLNPALSIKAFMVTCLKNHVLNMIRSNKKKIANTFELTEADHPITNCTADEIQMNEYRKIMHDGVNSMPDQKKRVFEMKVFMGESNREVAAKLGISINTVKVHYYHSRQFMKSYLKKEAGLDSASL